MISVIHTSLSTIYLLLAILSIYRFTKGAKSTSVSFKWIDEKIALSLLVTLYLQMMMGVYLFYRNLSQTVVMHNNSLDDRFWPVEHFFVMFFSILTAQLGYIYSKNIKKADKRYKSLAIYYSVSFVLVLFSLTMIFL